LAKASPQQRVIFLSAPFSEIYYGQLCGQSKDILPALDIYQSAEVEILGKPFNLCIIGASHFIYSKELDYSEIFACAPLSLANLNVLDVRKLGSKELEPFVLPEVRVTTRISVEAYDETQLSKKKPLLEYAFEPQGLTQIWQSETGWETLHTYPEYEACVRTQTTLALV
jgi:hypothetical protein